MSAENITSALPVGYMLQNYQIERALKQGAFGITYLAKEEITDYPVVIKENFPIDFADRDPISGKLRPEHKCEESYRWAQEHFERTATLLHKLPRHNNIVHVTNVFRKLNTTYCVMEKIEGRNLAELYPINSQMEPQLLENILRKLLSALDFLHNQGILHRDIKPGNIILTPEGEPVLIDSASLHSMADLRDAELIGTRGFAPPEQFTTGSELGPWTDIYALGATCYTLITGQIPRDSLYRMTDETYRPLATRPELKGRYSPELLASIDKALALRAGDRWQSAQEWLEVIDTLMKPDSELLSHELPAGYKLRDTYTLTETLGQGGFGITYLATEDVTGRRVVVKENFPSEFSIRNNNNHHAGPAGASRKKDYDWALGSFLNEAKILTRLRHPNIVPVLTAFKALGTAYYVMDYIGGLPLHEAAPQQVTEQWLLGILRPMLSALHYIHTLPDILLHRDIKPNNILVTPKGTPILIDFGAARSVISTHTHSKVGTPRYSPPEQLSNTTAPGPWTDLYALGATCYYLLTGQNPPDCYDRMPDETYRPLAPRPELQKRFSPALLASIDKAFALRPTDRWQSAQDWLNALPGNSPSAAIYTPTVGTIPLRQPETNYEEIVAKAKQLIDSKQYDGVPDMLRPAAESGYAPAQNLLGQCYYYGLGVQQNYTKAAEWYRKAALQGNADAQINLGMSYFHGCGVPQDYSKAVEWFQKAAEQDEDCAQCNLGDCYRDGLGVQQNYTKAAEWYRKAALQGNANAQNNLGFCYENGRGMPQNYAKAAEWYRKAAEQGNPYAQYNVGVCYENGLGVQKDIHQAIEWYRKASLQGNENASTALKSLNIQQ